MTSEFQSFRVSCFDRSESWTQAQKGEEDKGIKDSIGAWGETVHKEKKLEKGLWQGDMDRSRKRVRGNCGACRAAVQVVDPSPGGN